MEDYKKLSEEQLAKVKEFGNLNESPINYRC